MLEANLASSLEGSSASEESGYRRLLANEPSRTGRDLGWAMKSSFEDSLIEVWRQVLVENAQSVKLGPERYAVRHTSNRRLRQVDFVLDGEEIRGLEQNPETKSSWAKMARSGKKVMQFLVGGRYVGNVVDGKATVYGRKSNPEG